MKGGDKSAYFNLHFDLTSATFKSNKIYLYVVNDIKLISLHLSQTKPLLSISLLINIISYIIIAEREQN